MSKRTRECVERQSCPAPADWRAPEEHQGRLYSDDVEMVCGWQVFGRGPSAGARNEWEYGGRVRCSIALCPNDPAVFTVETTARNIRIPAAVLVAIGVRVHGRAVDLP